MRGPYAGINLKLQTATLGPYFKDLIKMIPLSLTPWALIQLL